jgi:ERF superfamily
MNDFIENGGTVDGSGGITVAGPQSLAVTEGPGALLSAIVQLARDPAVDVTKLQALLGMQERMEARQGEIEFDRALARIAGQMPRVKKNGTVNLGQGKGSYAFATWEDMDTIIRPLMASEGFTLSFTSELRNGEGGGLIVTGTLLHRDGHSKSASMPLPLDTGAGRSNIQAAGSTLSYGKRYTAEMLLNIVREGVDDDGKAGGTKFITEEQATELRAMAKSAKREEGPLLDKQFGGTVRSFEEIEVGQGYFAIKSTLHALIQQQAKKAAI